MLQRWLLFLLAAEAAVHVGVAMMLFARGWSAPAIVALVLLCAFLWRLSHALGSFVVCAAMRLLDGRRDAGMLQALVGEFTARLLSFNIAQPFHQWVMADEPAVGIPARATRAAAPILLVHGYVSNRGIWACFRRRLVDNARANIGPVYTINLETPFDAIETLVAQLDQRIEAICAGTGQQQIIVIAHSMGGLVARGYLAAHGAARIAKLVTLGTPHHGTRTAAFGIGISARQMCWNSAWLSALAKKESGRPLQPPPTASIYTVNDDMVYPPESARLDWAENVAVHGVGHVGLLFSEAVVNRVILAIDPYVDNSKP